MKLKVQWERTNSVSDFVLACLAFLVGLIIVLDLVHFLSDPKSYPIGWDGGGWSYASEQNYLLVSAGQILLVFGVLLGLLWPFGKWHRRRARLAGYGFIAFLAVTVVRSYLFA